MPTVRPFRGLRYVPETAGDIAEIVAPPYDIIYDEWRERLYDRNPYNIIRLIKTRDESDDSADTKYSRAASYIDDWMDRGVLRLDDEPVLYVCADTYTVNGSERTRYGFIGLLRVEDFGDNVHPHERTLSAPKVDRLKLIRATKTNLSQIFSVFRDPENIIQPLLLRVSESEPAIHFTDEQGVTRRLWTLSDPDIIAAIVEFMKNRDIIIADGHHRYETAIAYRNEMEPQRHRNDEPFDYVSMYFSNADDPGMTILPTHRKVSGVSSYNQGTFFSELDKLFYVRYGGDADLEKLIGEIAVDSDRNNSFVIYTCNGFGTARLRNPDSPKELDVNILHSIIIEQLLGITREAIASGEHVHFCKSPDHAIEDVANNKDQISFIMNALTTDELFRTVLKGERMPQKSTYFYPKTMSGLVMYRIERPSLG
ncbi:MAG: DUF1015 domain-containing protein [Candidatus Latescibacteria bacterium]|nr:DUF1015 domain-containing protein [Candidatus Latescibacterota bacterium]